MGDLLVSSLFYGVIGIIVLFVAFYSVVVYYKKQDEKTYEKKESVYSLSQEDFDTVDFWQNYLLPLKMECNTLLEAASKNKDPKNPMDAMMEIDKSLWKDGMSEYEVACLLGVSRIIIGNKTQVHNISDEPKCQRCWRREETVDKRSDGGLLCNRCAHAIGV